MDGFIDAKQSDPAPSIPFVFQDCPSNHTQLNELLESLGTCLRQIDLASQNFAVRLVNESDVGLFQRFKFNRAEDLIRKTHGFEATDIAVTVIDERVIQIKKYDFSHGGESATRSVAATFV